MKKFLLSVFLLSCFTTAFSQDCTDCRYISPVFDSVTVETVHFGQGLTIDGDTMQLYMDVYQPYGDTMQARPVIIFAFGGGFVQGSRTDWYVIEVCNQFAKAGYVCVAPDYRTGIDYGEILALQHMRIFFRPMQDMRACIQQIKADYSELGNNFKVDTNKIFVGGASSGAITALMTQYCDKESEMAQMGDIAALNALGGFNSSTGYYPNYSWNGVAVINVAGALIDANWIDSGNIPVISAHGDADAIVPYKYGGFGGISFGFFDLQGSFVVDSMATAKGVCSYLYTMAGQNHPSDTMGVEYIKSVVHRLALRAHAVLTGRSFCCPMKVDVQPGDTLFHWYDQVPVDVTLTSALTNDNGNAIIQWCSIPCQFSGTGNSITFQEADTNLRYVVAMAYEGGCESSDLYIVSDTAMWESIHEYSYSVDFSVYPQPANSQITISADLKQNSVKAITVELYNIKGQTVFVQQFPTNQKLQVSIETNDFPSGNYLLRLKSGNEILGAKKIIVSR